MKTLLSQIRALDDETRLRILASLAPGEMCVCQILELFDLAPSTISKHLSLLRNAGLVESRKQGRWIFYRLPPVDASTPEGDTLTWILKRMEPLPAFRSDRERRARIMSLRAEDLCPPQEDCPDGSSGIPSTPPRRKDEPSCLS